MESRSSLAVRVIRTLFIREFRHDSLENGSSVFLQIARCLAFFDHGANPGCILRFGFLFASQEVADELADIDVVVDGGALFKPPEHRIRNGEAKVGHGRIIVLLERGGKRLGLPRGVGVVVGLARG